MRKLLLKGLMIGMICLSVFSSCNSGKKPDEVVSEELDAIKNLDEATMEELFNVEDAGEKTAEKSMEDKITEILFNNMDYKIISSSTDGDTAIVKTEIINFDMKVLMQQYTTNIIEMAKENAEKEMTEEEEDKMIDDALIELLSKKDNKKITKTIDIKLKKEDGNWIMQDDEMFYDALLGGFGSTADQIEEAEKNDEIPLEE